ncbi:hypothetical protein SASPL_102175 [Salvia splendens]|uniref:Uncharacterized protein n=1 Tax=Salvia splendens TaxID=180675 RepID=A0A8X9AD60_SALSN|nr:hypothetical protein SASPL_102175 [Salvia splendens]
MKDLNSKLAMENFLIMQQNEKLKKMTEFFSQENQALLNELNHQLAVAAAAGIPIPHDLNRPTSTSSSSAAANTSSSKANKATERRDDTQEVTEGYRRARHAGGDARKGVAENVLGVDYQWLNVDMAADVSMLMVGDVEISQMKRLCDIENDDLRQQQRLARLEKHRGKSNPMRSIAPKRRSMDDPLFSDVFTSYDADEPSKNCNNNILSMSVYDMPVYDEDILLMPVYDEPVYDEDILSMPVYDTPVYDEDILSMPVYDKPVYDNDDLTDSAVATSSSRNSFLDKEKLGSKVAGIDWNFSGYGGIDEGCYDDWSLDLLIAHKVQDIENVPRFSHSMIFEGGSIQFDGEGMCFTTEGCLKYKEVVEGNGGGFGSGKRGWPKGSKNRKILQLEKF